MGEVFCQFYSQEEFKEFGSSFNPQTLIAFAIEKNWMLGFLPASNEEKPTRIKVPASASWGESLACFLTPGGGGEKVLEPLQVRFSVVVDEENEEEGQDVVLRLKVVFLNENGELNEVTMMTDCQSELNEVLELLENRKKEVCANFHFAGKIETEWQRIL